VVYSRLLDWLLPRICLGCGQPADAAFCIPCRGEITRVERPCARCGLALPVAACPRSTGSWSIDRVFAPYRYVEPMRDYLHALKFGGQRSIGRALGELLAGELRAAGSRVDALIAVPLHRHRFLERGYNQAVEIARGVSANLAIPLLLSGAVRTRATHAQTDLDSAQRHANLRDAFCATRELTGHRIAIVDDVLTTGATANALGHALLRAGAASVEAWTVARSL